METYTLDDIKREVYGEMGTPRRDKIEAELANLRVGLQIRQAREQRGRRLGKVGHGAVSGICRGVRRS